MKNLPLPVLPGFQIVTTGEVMVGDHKLLLQPSEWVACSASDVRCEVTEYHAVIRRLPSSAPVAMFNPSDFGDQYFH